MPSLLLQNTRRYRNLRCRAVFGDLLITYPILRVIFIL
ncbi:hypothetical protein ADILRU_1386 [Leifsonia rubra CMS 76R]|nr:hypothetical protein ADILRU_1386 [Leifsonia rubra CMS 76R]